LLLIIIVLILYKLNVKFSHIVEHITFWFALLIITLVSFAYIASITMEFNIAAITLTASSLLMVIFPLSSHLRNFWLMRSPKGPVVIAIVMITITYIVIAFLIILLFLPLYSLSGIFEESDILKITNHTKITGKADLFYFSSLVFYSTIFGDFEAKGYSRILVILELLISFIIHIIILGVIISSFNLNRNKNENLRKLHSIKKSNHL